MDFFKNIGSAIGTGVSNIGNFLTAPLQGKTGDPLLANIGSAFSNIGGTVKNALGNFLGNTLGLGKTAQAPEISPQGASILPQPNQPYYSVPIPQYETQTSTTVSPLSLFDQHSTNPSTNPLSSTRPLSPTLPSPSAPISIANPGTPTPGQSGTGGTSSTGGVSQFSGGFSSVPVAGAAGSSGFDTSRSSPVTGYSSSGGAATYPAGQQPQEDQKKAPLASIKLNSPFELPPGMSVSSTPQGGTMYKDAQGNAYLPSTDAQGNTVLNLAPQTLPGQQALGVTPGGQGFVTAAPAAPVQVQPFAPAPAFNAGSPGSVVDMGTMQANISKIQDIVTSGKFTKDDLNNFMTKLKDYSTYLANNKVASSQVGQGPSVPNNQALAGNNPANIQILNNMPTQTIDSIMAKYNVPNILTDINKMRAQIEAEAQAYDDTIKEIKNNPDLPQALADRRIQMIQDAQNTNLNALKLKYGFLTDSYNIAIGQAKDELGLQKDANAQANTNADNARQMLQTAMNSGATLSPTDVSALASMMGISVQSVQSMLDTAAAKKKDYQSIGSATDQYGNLTIYGVKPDGSVDTLKTLQDIGKPTTSTTTDATQKTIVSQINSAVDQYKLNPQGFRENYVNSLVQQFGPQYKDFITSQVYNLMPDLASSIPSDVNGLHQYFATMGLTDQGILKAANDMGIKGANDQAKIQTFLSQQAAKIQALKNAGLSDDAILKYFGLSKV